MTTTRARVLAGAVWMGTAWMSVAAPTARAEDQAEMKKDHVEQRAKSEKDQVDQQAKKEKDRIDQRAQAKKDDIDRSDPGHTTPSCSSRLRRRHGPVEFGACRSPAHQQRRIACIPRVTSTSNVRRRGGTGHARPSSRARPVRAWFPGDGGRDT